MLINKLNWKKKKKFANNEMIPTTSIYLQTKSYIKYESLKVENYKSV
jgi:hypothetical protein